jgi:hypothetical protein
MLRKTEITVLLVLACCAFATAAQNQLLKIVPNDAPGLKAGTETIRVEWVELPAPGSQVPKETPAEAQVYYSATPAGGDLSRYRRLGSAAASNVLAAFGTGSAQKRYTTFVPNSQGSNMGPGAYYGIVAAVVEDDTLYSDYFNIMVESQKPPTLVSPKANIMGGGLVAKVDGLTPTFSWSGVPGVPYYHVILSDEAIFQKKGSEYVMSDGISVIWQAITPNTQITYGAPDPSNTITATPPPLTPGKTYSWMVLNNYGNHMAYSSSVVEAIDLVLGSFEITGTPIDAPRVVSPARGASFNSTGTSSITFEWTNLDERANSYLINLFSSAGSNELGLGGGLGNISANLLVWEATVSRGGKGKDGTLSVVLDAAGTLTGKDYTWRVYALDSRGAGSTDVNSTSSFTYNANTGTVNLKTEEVLGGVRSPVGFVELRTEVLSGPTQAPLAFYTGSNGEAGRPFPVGTYRFTAVKDGYYNQAVTVSVQSGGAVNQTISMSRPEAKLYGKVTAASGGSAINLARVVAVSEWGDTLSALTDGGGSFTLSCRAADWSVYVEKAGYRSTSPRRVPLRLGDNMDFGTVRLDRNPFALSGVVRNGSGEPVMGAKVRVLTSEGALVEELASTPQSGAYSFYLNSGTYVLTAEKPGFVMFSRSVSVTGARGQDITIREGATLVNGSIIGKSWVVGVNGYVSAPVASAVVRFWEEGARDTFMVVSDAVFGKFSISLPSEKTYNVRFHAAGFDSGADTAVTTDAGGATMAFTDTLYALAMIKGNVSYNNAPLGGVSVLVYNSDNEVVASGRTSSDGSYEVRNIPNGANFRVGAGVSGYYSTTPMYSITNIENGRPTPNTVSSYDFVMAVGDRSISWEIAGFGGSGSIKVISPLNAVIPFSGGAASREQVGPGRYVIEAVAESDPTLLQLSYHTFELGDAPDSIYFQLRHQRVDTLGKAGELSVEAIGQLHSTVSMIELFYRSEGSTRYRSVSRAIRPGDPYKIEFTPERDGCAGYYYFRVHLANGDIYGSGKQVFSAYVRPDAYEISRITIEPGAAGEATRAVPSSYDARFAFRAFYSDQFMPVSGQPGSVAWSVSDESGAVIKSLTDAVLTYTTPAEAQTLTLKAKLVLPQPSPYKFKGGIQDSVTIHIRVTGAARSFVAVRRNGEEGPISSTQRASFSIEALDAERQAVTVSPQWSIVPAAAGSMDPGSGVFEPRPDFFGTARVIAATGGQRYDYRQEGAKFPGQTVNFVLRHRESGSDTADTRAGMRLVFPAGSVPSGESVEFNVSVPDLKNYVHRGSNEFRMADSAAFDLSCAAFERIGGEIAVIFDIPEHLREAAKKNSQEFRVARWFVDSLKWIPVENSEIINNGAAISARLSNGSSEGEGLGKITHAKRGLNRKAVKSAVNSAASEAAVRLAASARYALVTKSNKLSVSMSVSPHPFSPYISPVREYGPDAPEGTCVKVNVEAQDGSVRSIKVHIYNATGKRVWAVDKQNAPTGENRFWWNGRTSGRGNGRTSVSEEVWSDDFGRNRDRPMCRNGRYFATVIVTDINGDQKRLMKPVVLMK